MRVHGLKFFFERCCGHLRAGDNQSDRGSRAGTAAQHVDTFHRSTLLALTAVDGHRARPPMATAEERQNYQTVLRRLIDDINVPHWRIAEADDIDTDLTALIVREPQRPGAYLWRGILKRTMGEDPSSDLREVLRLAPGNRLALLNLAAAPITCRALRADGGRIASALRDIDDFRATRPQDAFADLIATMLRYLRQPGADATLEALEDLYERHPQHRAMTAALLAAVLLDDCRRPAAVDFAQEALQLGGHSALAHNILVEHDAAPMDGPYAGVGQLSFEGTIACTGFELAFMAPYAQQDRAYSGDGTTL